MILIALSDGIFEKIKRVLEKGKFRYERVVSGEELVERAKKARPQLIILEKDLPLLDGFAATLLLKSHPKTKNIPILTICKCDFPEERVKARDSGADFVLLCPLKEEELSKVIQEAVKN